MTREALVEKAYQVFSVFEKPEQCTTGDDLEAAEFSRILYAVSRHDLTAETVGTVAWGPIPSLNPEALAYFMPRLIELAVNGALNRDGEPFLIQFVNAFADGPADDRYVLFERAHRTTVSETFEYLCERHGETLSVEGWLDEARRAVKDWLAE